MHARENWVKEQPEKFNWGGGGAAVTSRRKSWIKNHSQKLLVFRTSLPAVVRHILLWFLIIFPWEQPDWLTIGKTRTVCSS